MLYIDVPDRNDSISVLSIDGKEYGLRFTYNEKYGYWSFGLYEEESSPIIAMTRIVPNFPLLHFYTGSNIPVGRDAFVNRTAEFVYIPNVELEK